MLCYLAVSEDPKAIGDGEWPKWHMFVLTVGNMCKNGLKVEKGRLSYKLVYFFLMSV